MNAVRRDRPSVAVRLGLAAGAVEARADESLGTGMPHAFVETGATA